jgi:leucyl-tRNA synthetase
MSKSRRNVVIPDDYVDRWGADTFRMYLMFLGPYQEGGDFRDEGIAGIRRFLDKVWSVVGRSAATNGAALPEAVERKLHQTIRKVTDDIDGMRYNTAISAMMEYLNTVRAHATDDDGAPIPLRVIEPLVIMLAPFAPFLAEECWERLGHDDGIFAQQWPTFDEALAREETIELVAQVNGKVRGRLTTAVDVSEEDALTLAQADDGVKKHVEGKEIRKVIFVPGRLINIVVG